MALPVGLRDARLGRRELGLGAREIRRVDGVSSHGAELRVNAATKGVPAALCTEPMVGVAGSTDALNVTATGEL